jgi:hypothetical protein
VAPRGIALLAVGIALVAASARAQSAQVVAAPTVYATHDLPANAVTTFTVPCSAGYAASSAGVATPGPGTIVLAIAPAGLRGYRFRIGNPATNGDQRVRVAVACRKVLSAGGGPRFTLKLKPLRTRYLTVPARKAASAALACPPGTVPARGGADLDLSRGKTVDAYRAGPGVSLRRQTATLRRFTFSLQNTATQAKRVALYGGCLTLTREAGAPRVRLHVRATSYRVLVHPGAQVVTRRCRTGWVSLAAGFSLRNRVTNATGAAAVAGGGRWSVLSDGATDTLADVQLACGRVGP